MLGSTLGLEISSDYLHELILHTITSDWDKTIGKHVLFERGGGGGGEGETPNRNLEVFTCDTVQTKVPWQPISYISVVETNGVVR